MTGKFVTDKSTRLGPVEVVTLLLVPVVLVGCALARIEQAAILTLVVVLAALGVFFAGFESSRPSLRTIMPTVVLAALAAAGRILFAAIPDVKPVSAIAIMAGVVFGRRSGFMVGALAALVSNFFFGQGPWTPWQMYAWGMVGYLAGVLADWGAFEWRVGKRGVAPVLYVYGFASGLLYGFLLNTWYIVGFVQPFTIPAALTAYALGLPLDLVHATATVAFLVLLYEPWRVKLGRIKTKYELGT